MLIHLWLIRLLLLLAVTVNISIMKKLLFLAHSANIGGAELALKGLIDSIQGDYTITVVLPTKKKPNPIIINSRVSYISIPLPWWCHEAHDSPTKINKKQLTTNYEKLKSIAKNHDILLTNTITIPWLGFVATELSKPHIWYIHEFGNIDHNLKFILGYKRSLQVISKTSSRILTISNAVKNHISQAIPTSQIDIIHQSIELDKLIVIKPCPVDIKNIKLLCMGAMKPSKGQDIAVGAVKQLRDKGITVSLDIIGPSANSSFVEKLNKFSSDYDNVTIKSQSFNVIDELSSHNALLMCSSNEALGRVTIESMASGLPVIGFASPSTKYLLGNNRGLLYTENNAKSLANAIEKFINKPNLINTKSAQVFVKNNFSNDVQAKDFNKCVENALSTNAFHNNCLNEYLDKISEDGLLYNTSGSIKNKVKVSAIKYTPKTIKKIVKKLL